MNSRKKDTLTLLLIIVIVIIIGVIGYLGFEFVSRNIKESQSNDITNEFDERIPTLTEEEIREIRLKQAEENQQRKNNINLQDGDQNGDNNSNEGNNPNDEQNPGDSEGNQSQEGNSSSDSNSSSSSNSNSGTNRGSNSGQNYSSGGSNSAGISISNMWVLGKIQIPATNVRCSIFDDPSPQALEKGVGVVYTMNGLNKPGNTVIAGHNYKNRLFFSKNKNLAIGNYIKITDVSGLEITYEIYNKFITNQDDASFFQRDTGGKREITLTTCTDDGLKTGQRIIIFAKEE